MHSFLRYTCSTIKGIALCALIHTLTWSHMAYAVTTNEVLSLSQAVALVQQSSVFYAAQQQVLALEAVPVQVGSLPDPVLSFAARNWPVDTFSRDQENMTQLQFSLSQTLPFPGKLSLKQSAATWMAAAASDDVEELRLQLIYRLKASWWNLVYLDRAHGTVLRNQVLLRQFIRIAETKYKVGKGLQQDVLLAQLELSKLLDVAIRLKSSRLQEQATFNALLNRPMYRIVLLPPSIDEFLPEAESASALIAKALVFRPVFRQQQKHILAAQARVSLAKKDYYPDFTLGAQYGLRSAQPNGVARADLTGLSFSMTLPFFTGDKRDAGLQQRQAELARAAFSLQDVQSQVSADIAMALASYKQAKEQSLLFKTGIIPQASLTVASMLAAYQVNKVDFLNLVRAQITLYNYETQYWKTLAAANQSLARLDAAVGHIKENNHE